MSLTAVSSRACIAADRNQQKRQAFACRTACALPTTDGTRTQRRAMLLRIVSVPVLLSAVPLAPALALIVDDSDEELIEKLASRRKEKLAQEKIAEREFARDEGFVNKALEKELVPVQRAVKKLAQSGKALEDGDVKAAAAALSGGWVGELEAAGNDLSGSAAAKAGFAPVLKSISDLQGAAASGNLRAAKGSYVTTVDALTAWVNAAGIQASIKGI